MITLRSMIAMTKWLFSCVFDLFILRFSYYVEYRYKSYIFDII